jgi:YegS/Rv2252/BmrU family lipid kinase
MLTGIQDALLIHNPAAGRRQSRRARDLDDARLVLRQAGIAVEIADTSRPGHAILLARQAVQQGRGMVIACGGDGTVNEVANGLAGSRVPLAILPAGTANVLGKELGLPWDIPSAVRRIPSGRLARIALGLAAPANPADGSGRYFVCIAGAGVDASMVYSVSSQLKQTTGTLAYWLAGLSHFFGYRIVLFSVDAGGHSFRASQVIVGRTKHYGGPFRITTGADLHSNCFEIAAFSTNSRFRYPAHMLAVWLSRLPRQRDVHFVHAQRVLCHADPGTKVYVEIDGEPAGRLPVEFRIVPDALTLVMPENETQARPAGVH